MAPATIALRVLSRTGSVRAGILAASSLDAAAALAEIRLLVRDGLAAAASDFDALTAARFDGDVALLLRAERHWLAGICGLIDDAVSPADTTVDRIVAALPDR